MKRFLCVILLCCMTVSSAHTGGGDDGVAIRRRIIPCGLGVSFSFMTVLGAAFLVKGINDWRESRDAKMYNNSQSIQKEMDGDRAPLLIVVGGICALFSAGCGWLIWNNLKLRDIPILKIDAEKIKVNKSGEQASYRWEDITVRFVQKRDSRGRYRGEKFCIFNRMTLPKKLATIDLQELGCSKQKLRDYINAFCPPSI